MLTATGQYVNESMASNEFVAQSGESPGMMRDDLLQLIRNHERHININPDNARQMQAIRILGVDLRRVADRMQIRPERRVLDASRRAMIQEGLSNEEIQVVRRIYAETASPILFNVARHLKECLTSQTFRMALEFLSSSTSSVSEELAAACELVRLIYPTVQEAIQASPIYDELEEFIEAKLDEVLH